MKDERTQGGNQGRMDTVGQMRDGLSRKDNMGNETWKKDGAWLANGMQRFPGRGHRKCRQQRQEEVQGI